MNISVSTGRTLSFIWVHSSHNFESRPTAGALRQALDQDAKKLGRRLTLCEASQVGYSGTSEDGKSIQTYATLGQGVAVCHPNDVFSKSSGRKKALGKAMLAAGLSYAERAEVWAAYLNLFGREK